jgi:hypothetical protein
MRVVVFLEDGEDGGSAGTLLRGDGGRADMTAQDGCFYYAAARGSLARNYLFPVFPWTPWIEVITLITW